MTAGSEILNKNWTFIQEKNYFPAVDLLISYPSTLVTEYSNNGVAAVIHNVNAEMIEVQNTVDEVRKKLAGV